jgi:invasion protein IalB
MSKKVGIVAVLCLAVFSGFVAPLAGQLNVKPQSALYKQSTTHIAWQVCCTHHFIFSLSIDSPICRTQQRQQVWQPGDSSLRLSPSSLVEARSYSGR